MTRYTLALLLALAPLTASAANRDVVVPYATGSTLRAFAATGDLANYVASAVSPTVGSGANAGKYTFTLDEATEYVLFVGATQPANWDLYIGTIPAATSVAVGQEVVDDIVDGVVAGGLTAPQPRINRKPDPAFTFKAVSRADGTYVCTGTLRPVAGTVETLHVAIDMSPLFGPDNYVKTVGTPVVSGGSITAAAEGPRDTYAFIEVDGTATSGESRTITVPITMTTDAIVQVKLNVKVLAQ